MSQEEWVKIIKIARSRLGGPARLCMKFLRQARLLVINKRGDVDNICIVEVSSLEELALERGAVRRTFPENNCESQLPMGVL